MTKRIFRSIVFAVLMALRLSRLDEGPAELIGIPQLHNAILFNLPDNAIKYNHRGAPPSLWYFPRRIWKNHVGRRHASAGHHRCLSARSLLLSGRYCPAGACSRPTLIIGQWSQFSGVYSTDRSSPLRSFMTITASPMRLRALCWEAGVFFSAHRSSSGSPSTA